MFGSGVMGRIGGALLGGLCMAVAHAAVAEGQDIKKGVGWKIIGGFEVTHRDYPWQVALLDAWNNSNFDAQFCGGAQIDKDWVITAAHCTNELEATDIEVLSGTDDLQRGGTRVAVAAIFQHPGYDPQRMDNDIALLKLDRFDGRRAGFTNGRAPVTRTPNYEAPGARATVIGWGYTMVRAADARPSRLQAVSLPIVDNATCSSALQAIEPGSFLSERQICAGFPEGGRDSCQGDSGGPLVVPYPGRPDDHILVGVVSWGFGCAQPNAYGVYTRVSAYIDWIQQVIGTGEP